MKRFSEQLKKKSETLNLKEGEKRDLKDRLVSYMEYHPLPKDSQVSAPDKKNSISVGLPVKIFHIKTWKTIQWSGVFMVALLLVVPYVAERAVPGDMLYAVKVNFNEELRSTLARSSYEKVVWETERLNRRISEARLLAVEGKMTEEIEESVAEAVRKHSENARKEIKHLKEVDEGEAVLASLQLDTAIDVQSASLRKEVEKNIKANNNNEENSTRRIVDILDFEAKAVGSETSSSSLPTRERLIGQVERETTRAYELLSSIKDLATEEEKKDILRRLEDIDRKTEVVLESFEMDKDEQDDIDARPDMLGILQDTQKLIVFMTNIDVRSTVTVDEIVPVTLTKEERLDILNQKRQEIADFVVKVEDSLNASGTKPEVAEKAFSVVDEIKDSLVEIDNTIETDEYEPENIEKEVDAVYDTLWAVIKVLNLSDQKVISEDEGEQEEESEGNGEQEKGDGSGDTSTSSEPVIDESISDNNSSSTASTTRATQVSSSTTADTTATNTSDVAEDEDTEGGEGGDGGYSGNQDRE